MSGICGRLKCPVLNKCRRQGCSGAQRKLITDLVDLQRKDLVEIVKTRRAIATGLRRFEKGRSADKVL
jgi:hypothetical protein